MSESRSQSDDQWILEVSKNVDIADELNHEGLDSKHWLPIFKTQLGVTSQQALSDIGDESYTDLERFTQKPRDKKALRKVLGIKEQREEATFETSRPREKLRKRHERAKDMLQRLKNQQIQGKDRHDSSVQSTEHGIREALQIPTDSWIPQDETLETVTGHLEICMSQINTLLETRELSDISVLQNASGGLALQGILLSSNLEDQLHHRDKLLQAPKDIKLMMPFLSQCDEIVEFSSKNQEDQFIKSMVTLGYSVTASTTRGFWGVGSETLLPHGIFEMGETTEYHQEEQYTSMLKFSFVPLASSYFSNNQLIFSDTALEELKTIETLIMSNQPAGTVHQLCTLFFKKYGSHANKGHFHFGGIFWKNIQKSGSPAKASPIYDSPKTATGSMATTTVASEALSLTQKACLVASNSTWSLIDRGTNTVPVWEIIQMNHRNDFKMPDKVIQTLIESWEQMSLTKVCSESEQLEDDIDLLLKSIRTWNQDDMSQCENHLAHLLKVKENVVRTSRNLHTWPTLYLSQVSLQNYLTSVMESRRDDSSGKDSECIKNMLKQLVCPSDVHSFQDLGDISQWPYHVSADHAKVPSKCADLMSLKALLQQVKDDMISAKAKSTMYAESAEQQGVRIIATTIVVHAINHIRGGLREAKYEELFLLTLLFPLWYDVNEKIFLRPLSICDVEYLHRELEEQSEEFYEMEYEPLMNLQSYLFHLAVKIYNSENDLDITESQIKSYLQYMQMRIQSELDSQIRLVLSRFYTDTDWKILQSELESLVNGFPLLEGTGLGARLIDVLSVKSASETLKPSKFSDTENLSQRSGNIQVLFKKLGLERHYKEKLTLQDALVIRQEVQENEKCTQLEQLPMFILQKVMMHDYHSGTIPFQHQPKSKSPKQRKPDDSCSSDSDSVTDSNSDSDSGSDDVASDVQPFNVHPMDVLLALLHCSDNFLRQDLLTRLSTCQLAIPLLLPDPFTNELTLSLWAMRSIVKEWKCMDFNSGKAISNECHIVNQPTPIVSFYRFDKSRSSKSKMLNFVISNNLHYPFSNFDSGSTKRFLMDGLVELCWFLPAGKPNDPFPKVITFLNLRGDARHHPKQTEFLSRVSFMNFVLLTHDDLNERGLKILYELAKAPGGLVLMFSKKLGKNGLELLHKTITKKQYSKVKLSNQGVDDITTAIRDKIKQKLSACEGSHLRNPTHYTKVAHEVGINVDEEDPECVQGRELADSIRQALIKSSSRSKSMNKIFPLQSGKLWHDWARQDKEKHRHLGIGTAGVEQYNTQKQDEKQRIRLQQLSVLECKESVIHSFILSLLKYKGNVRKYFIQWLKFFLDNTSHEKLSQIQDQYQAQRHQYKTSTEGPGNHKYSLGVDSSIGLEHFLRELGQVYEAVVEQKEKVSPDLRDKISRLPQVAAELLSAGYPLELMDGCASCVPLKWVCAVLRKLRVHLWNAHLFVLSVLGLQGSGKSTLLNTMFGLQFKVSVGRCTRGAFIQLLPFSESLKKRVNCDYLLVVDTEGLHSPENTSPETHKHDNELATFVTGLADVTIVNIMGETPGEMENILQTAVHAFIRMKNVQLNPSCQFVHQNVGTMMAQVKGMAGRDILREKLDKMTKAAANEELCGGMYAVFNDVIEFDDEKDVWYFPNLWDGNPPMARVNPGYSESALKLKSRFIDLAETKGNQCSFSTFEARIKDLWHAVLFENFVFSFKNTLEIIAYKRLDAEYAKWSWTFQLRMIEWEQLAENEIGNTTDSQELEDLEKDLVSKLPSKVTNIHTHLHKDMNEFFEQHEQRDILVQWKGRTELRLNDLRREQETLAITQCKMLVSNQTALAAAVAIKTKHLDELLLEVLQLVPHNKEGQVSDSELEKVFDQKWAERMTEFKSITVYETDPGIETSVQKCLKELLEAHEYILNPKLTSKSLRERALEPQVALEFKVIESTHITTKTWSLRKPLTLIQNVHINAQNLKAAQEATDAFLATARQYLESKRMCYYHPCFCHEMLNNLLQAITAKEEIPFTSEYKVDMALTLCGYALTQFEKMAEDFRKKNDPIERLEQEMKTPLFLLFKSQYHKSAKERTAAAILCNLLAKPIHTAVVRSLSHKVAHRMKQDHDYLCSKRSLKGKILCDLADMGSFDDYVTYLTNVSDSIQVWLQHYTKKYCEQKVRGRTKLVALAEEALKVLVTQISEKAEQVTESLTTALERTDAGRGNHDATLVIKQWLHDFHVKLRKDLTVDLCGIQKVVGAAKDLKDFNYKFFTEELCEGLKMMKVNEAISMESSYRKPYNILSEILMGCSEKCPFCKEQCELTNHHPGKHTIDLHRPACLGGAKGYYRELELDVCNSLVGSTKYFKNPCYDPDSDDVVDWIFPRTHRSGSDWKFQNFSHYRNIYPDWDIPPDRSKEVSSYWKWFVATYTSEIVAHFGAKRTKVPKDWKTLAKQTVMESVNKCYNLDVREEGFQLVSVTSFRP